MGTCPRSLFPMQGMARMRHGTRSWIHNVPWGKTRFWLLWGGKLRKGACVVTSRFRWLVIRRGQARRSPRQVRHGAGRSTSAGRGAQARSQASLGAQRAVPQWLCREMFSPPPDFPTKLLLFLLQFPWHYLRSPSQCLYTTTLVLSSALCCQHSKNTTETHTAAAAQGSAIGHSYRVLNKV